MRGSRTLVNGFSSVIASGDRVAASLAFDRCIDLDQLRTSGAVER